jgi:hypothetical protein
MKRIAQKVAQRVAPAIAGLAVPLVAFGQAGSSIPTIANPTAAGLFTVVCTVANWVFGFMLVGAVIAILVAGSTFFTAQGQEQKIETAKKFLTWALVGVAIVILAKSLIFVIGNLVGADLTGFLSC